MSKNKFIQVLAIVVLIAFFVMSFAGYFLEPTGIVTSGAKTLGTVFEKIVDFLTVPE